MLATFINGSLSKYILVWTTQLQSVVNNCIHPQMAKRRFRYSPSLDDIKKEEKVK